VAARADRTTYAVLAAGALLHTSDHGIHLPRARSATRLVPALVAVVWGARLPSSVPVGRSAGRIREPIGTLDARGPVAAAGLAALVFLAVAFALGEA
jgi:hypothetical protein